MEAPARGRRGRHLRPALLPDHYQSSGPDEPDGIGGLATWQDVLTTDPYAAVPVADRPLLLGIQGQLWTEQLPTPRHVDEVVWPRGAARDRAGPRWPRSPGPARVNGTRDVDESRTGVHYRPLDGPHPWQVGGTGR